MLGSQRKACLGMRQLEEVVLEVLFEARRNGECPGVAEISRRAGIWSWKGDTSKGEPGSMTHSIAWGIVLKLFRAGGVRRRGRSPGRSKRLFGCGAAWSAVKPRARRIFAGSVRLPAANW